MAKLVNDWIRARCDGKAMELVKSGFSGGNEVMATVNLTIKRGPGRPRKVLA